MNESRITYESNGESAEALAIQVDSRACIIVIHEVWGFASYIRDVCKQLSKLGFATIAPDLYWRNKKLFTPRKIRKAMETVWDLSLKERYNSKLLHKTLVEKHAARDTTELLRKLYSVEFRQRLLKDIVSCANYAALNYPRVGTLGFSLGGGLSLRLATEFPRLKSCVAFYGQPPEREKVKKIHSPMLTLYAGHDELINPKIPPFVEAVIENRKQLTLKLYPRAKHGFFDPTNKDTYNEDAAKNSWALAKDFLEETLQQQ